jgi:hypothetical protein
MLTQEDDVDVHALRKRGGSISAIAHQVVCDGLEIQQQELGDFGGASVVLPAEQDDRRGSGVRSGEDSPKSVSPDTTILLFASGGIHDLVVGRLAKSDVKHMGYVMPGVPKVPYQLGRLVLVEKESHAGRRSGSSRSCTASAA